MRQGSRRLRPAVGALIVAALAGPSAAGAATAPVIHVLSTRADLVSGGDALVRIDPPSRVTLNGRDVSNQFAVRPNHEFEGLLTGLAPGRNTLVASLPGGASASLPITDHPQSGPVFSGPQVQPWTCNAGALDAACDRKPTFTYKYMPAGESALSECTISQCFSQLQTYDPNSPPDSSQVATTTTDQGRTVPFIVRIETGSVDRGQYQIAVLSDPKTAWQPWVRPPGWNGKLEITGGASCGVGHTEASNPTVSDTNALGMGYAVASQSLLNNGNNCNIVTQAESGEMLKEYFVDHYGPIRFTIATGCSGGSIFQQQSNNAYPGLYDGEIVECSYPDDWTTNMEPIDCQLLLSYWNTQGAQSQGWTPAQEAAVDGHQSMAPCESWVNVFGYNALIDPKGPNSCGVPAADIYDPATNPKGIRCSAQDYMADVFGLRPPAAWTANERKIGHGFANRPYDNVGVQYGLDALRAGQITPGQFADLNASVGGLDIDARPQPARSAADPASLPIVYRSGAVNEYNHLAGVPIIDLRGHDTEEIHEDFRSYASRARLDRANGNHDNQVIWLASIPLVGDTQYVTQAFSVMDAWLSKMEADTRAATPHERVVRDKPSGAVDQCLDGTGHTIPSQDACRALFPTYQDPRIVAGEPFADDVVKCELEPLRRSDYLPVRFTDDEWAKLEKAFPSGVCDYSVGGVDQQGTVPWLTYASGPGGQPLGSPPASSAARSMKPRRHARRRGRSRRRLRRGCCQGL